MTSPYDMDQTNTWSYRNGKDIIKKKGILEGLPLIAQAYDQYGGGNQYLSERRELLEPAGWDEEVSITFEAPNTDGEVSRRSSFDAYKSGVLLEHESGEQMRANWHLLKMEAAHRDQRGFDATEGVDAGVLMIPDHVRYPTLERTENDVQAFLGNYFGFSIPLFVWEYPTQQ